MKETDSQNTENLKRLFEIGSEQRDEKWLEQIFANFPDAEFPCTNPQLNIGPDGFSYFGLYLPKSGEPCEYNIKGLLPFALQHGFGVAVFEDETLAKAVWLFSYGDLLSYSLYDSFAGDSNDRPSTDDPGGLKVEALESDREVFIGAPSENYFPEQSQNVVANFLKTKVGHPDPRICLVLDPLAKPSKNLAFNIRPENFGDERILASVMGALTWFFPRTYSLLAGPPVDPKFWLPLKCSPAESDLPKYENP